MGRKAAPIILLFLSLCLLLAVIYDVGAGPVEDLNTAESLAPGQSPAWVPVPADEDPLVRMPGSQPDQGIVVGGPSQCVNCHADYDPLTQPVENWQGSMMAQAARDFLFWSTM
ncbi:MAG: hypothetical protein ACK2T3_02905, partial [Candidatus Promineifilaceae bacterium]